MSIFHSPKKQNTSGFWTLLWNSPIFFFFLNTSLTAICLTIHLSVFYFFQSNKQNMPFLPPRWDHNPGGSVVHGQRRRRWGREDSGHRLVHPTIFQNETVSCCFTWAFLEIWILDCFFGRSLGSVFWIKLVSMMFWDPVGTFQDHNDWKIWCWSQPFQPTPFLDPEIGWTWTFSRQYSMIIMMQQYILNAMSIHSYSL